MGEFTGKSSFVFPRALPDEAIEQIRSALAAHGAKVDATAQTFTPDPEPPAYAFTCTVQVSDQMAADNTAGVVMGRALYDCGHLGDPAPAASGAGGSAGHRPS
ncbi:hypothetical protein GXW83_17230 [Streptacidiphilus sp. PB12-B1b]|uniref:hypothetical protein n=1 Tax=Streptacidiphilus sp. PB12-B1b TaxID=2705012 RepID=UPI0015FD9BCE|nr:hypothetical protein [Streptacidiphilus sp. PB12-B1b]QMU77190.1 hypothetical protein GXW83_17230 [Streptacidiphilus sp. PB12-B1b]